MSQNPKIAQTLTPKFENKHKCLLITNLKIKNKMSKIANKKKAAINKNKNTEV